MAAVAEATKDNFEEVIFGDKTARWFQVAARNGVASALERGINRILVVQPTGTGKTVSAAIIFADERIHRALGVKKGKKARILFIAHKNRLLTQAEREYATASNFEIILQSAFTDIPEDVEWDMCCIDEAHHEAMSSIQYQLEQLGDKPIIGLTATPDRADGCLIKFEAIIEPISREEAVAQGMLAETELNTFIGSADRNKVPMLKRMIEAYGDEMGQTMVFVRTKAEVRELTDWINEEAGYDAVSILDQSDKVCNQLIDDFGDGEFQFIVNCNKINEGVDVKGCTDVLLGRTFGSYPQLNQVIGRAARPDCECRVWEIVNPLSGRNLDTTVVVGTPAKHRLISTKGGEFVEHTFEVVTRMDPFAA